MLLRLRGAKVGPLIGAIPVGVALAPEGVTIADGPFEPRLDRALLGGGVAR